MKFRNKSNKVLFFKINEEFVNVGPNEIIELGENALSLESLCKVEELLENEELSKDDLQDPDDSEKSSQDNKATLDELKEMSKDALNDYGAINNIDINATMKKSEMIKKILEAQNGN